MCKINANNGNPFDNKYVNSIEIDKVKSLIEWIENQDEFICDYSYQEYLLEKLNEIRPIYLYGLNALITSHEDAAK